MLWIDLLALLILLILSAFFSASETALVSADSVRIRQLVKKGSKEAKIVEELHDNPQQMISAILIGNNIVNITATAIATGIALQAFQNYALGIVIGVMTFLILLFGEITPKGVAVHNSEKISLLVARPTKLLVKILNPLSSALNGIANFLNAIFGQTSKSGMTEQDIKTMVTMGAEAGAIEEEEMQLIHRIFKFNDTAIEEVMTAREDVKAVEADSTLGGVSEVLAATPFNRLPVYRKSLDNIIGVFYVKDAWDFLAEGKTNVKVENLLRPVLFTQKGKKIDKVLAEFQHTGNNMAIVLDEEGKVMGIATLEDLIEEIFGDIIDENDVPMVKKIKEGVFEADGRASLRETNAVLKTKWAGEKFHTIGGFMAEKLGRIPEQNEEISEGFFKLKAANVKGQRVLKVRITKNSEQAKP